MHAVAKMCTGVSCMCAQVTTRDMVKYRRHFAYDQSAASESISQKGHLQCLNTHCCTDRQTDMHMSKTLAGDLSCLHHAYG